MSALNFSHSWRPADDAEQENPIPSPTARETAKATRETNSAQKTRMGLWAPPTAEDHAAKPRDRAKQNRPLKGRHGSSSIGSSAFRAVGYPTRRPIQRNSTAWRKRAEHIQAVRARQPLRPVIIAARGENLCGLKARRPMRSWPR